MTSIKTAAVALGIILGGFMLFCTLKGLAINASTHDAAAQSFLKALYPSLLKYHDTVGQWPTKLQFPEHGITGISDDGSGDQMSYDAINLLWSECTLTQPTEQSPYVATIPSEEGFWTKGFINVLTANGEAYSTSIAE
jgi:hypothetical protein